MTAINIRPVTDLRNRYADVESDVHKGPVFLTKNGYGASVLVSIDYFQSHLAMQDTSESLSLRLQEKHRMRNGVGARRIANGARPFAALRKSAAERDDEWTLEDINAEIGACRAERKVEKRIKIGSMRNEVKLPENFDHDFSALDEQVAKMFEGTAI